LVESCPFTQKTRVALRLRKSIVYSTQEKFHETNNDDDRKIKRNWKSLCTFEVIIIKSRFFFLSSWRIFHLIPFSNSKTMDIVEYQINLSAFLIHTIVQKKVRTVRKKERKKRMSH